MSAKSVYHINSKNFILWCLIIFLSPKGICQSNLNISEYNQQKHYIDSVCKPCQLNDSAAITNCFNHLRQSGIFNKKNTLNFFLLKEIDFLKDKVKSTRTYIPVFEKYSLDAISKNDTLSAAVFLQKAADLYWDNTSYTKSLECYIKAYDYYKDFDCTLFPDKCDFIHAYASRYYDFRDFNTAQKLLSNVWQKMPISCIPASISRLNTYALCFSNQDKNDSAYFYFNRALNLARHEKSEVWYGIIRGNIASVLIKQGKLKEAIPLLLENIESSRKHNIRKDLAISLAALGKIYIDLNNRELAIKYLTEAHDVVLRNNLNNDFRVVSKVYHYLAQLYALTGKTDLAYAYLDSNITARDSINNRTNLIFISGLQQRFELDKQKDLVHKQETELYRNRLQKFFLISCFILVCIVAIIIIWQHNKVKKAKKRSDDLLLNILPSETAEELMEKGKAEARRYEDVTVMFTDFNNFTTLSSNMQAEKLVAEINDYYSEFDRIIEKFGLEKIKTIGDAYMCVAGMPGKDQLHAMNAVRAALAIHNFVNIQKSERLSKGEPYFDIRIGLHSGSVVAGIVGIKKFAYDIWGDTVNIASRMESSGESGKVNISGATYNKIKNNFTCSYRGKIEVKNIGETDMYFVEKEVISN